MPSEQARRRIVELMNAKRVSPNALGLGGSGSESNRSDVEAVIPRAVTIPLSPEMQQQMAYLVNHTHTPVDALALELLATELEAQVGLSRGPHLRKYLYR